MHVEAWSRTPNADMARLYEAEARRWHDRLHWDYEDTRRQLEQVRTQGHVPGFVMRDVAGDPCAWTFFLRVGHELQIGALTAATREVAAALLGRVLASPEAAGAARALYFGFADAPDADGALEAAGFTVGTYRYLVRSLTPDDAAGGASTALRPWRDGDLADAAGVLQAAYPAPDPLRPFGGAGEPGEWFTYAHRLVSTTGCGVFVPALSAVYLGGRATEGVAIVTRVASDTVHLAQVAVRPAARGHGIGAALTRGGLAAAARAGFARMTLLVSDANAPARHLYARLGFDERATFLSASRGPLA